MGLFQDIQNKLQSYIIDPNAPPPVRKETSGLFPAKINSGQYLYKEYQHVRICVIEGKEPDFSQLQVGDWLELRKEPFNKADPKAVAVYDRFQRIGYLWGGVGQDMANDFLDKGYAVFAFLTEIQGSELYLSYAFYKRRAPAKKK